MTGIIDAATQAEYKDEAGEIWTYFQDSANSALYYVVQAPGLAVSSGAPRFHLSEAVDTDKNFITASCDITTELKPPPPTVRAGIEAALKAKGVASPIYQGMPYLSTGTGPEKNWAQFSFADAGGTVSQSHRAMPSLTGQQQANFNLSGLTATEAQFFKDYFSGVENAGTVSISYCLTVPAHLKGVTARVQFNSAKAYAYQRTFKWVS
ncbi:hypothetical protein [Maricaulis sp.]|uniref:hypothetical protein n=1 Tax=Maricaulis sp. TaxID=1486257 RepID=UPI0026070F2D|nr:hypothetical protein [Maricaulis sp.]